MMIEQKLGQRPMLEDDDATWRNPKILAILLFVFLCGSAFGSAATRYFLHSRSKPTLSDLKSKLSLTPEQERIVVKELDEYAKYYQNIEEQREDVAEHGRQRIYYVLTPEQRKRFDSYFPVLPGAGARN